MGRPSLQQCFDVLEQRPFLDEALIADDRNRLGADRVADEADDLDRYFERGAQRTDGEHGVAGADTVDRPYREAGHVLEPLVAAVA